MYAGAANIGTTLSLGVQFNLVNKRRKWLCVTCLLGLPVCDYMSKNRTRVYGPPTTLLHSDRRTTDPLRLAVRTLCSRSQGATILGSSCGGHKSDKYMLVMACNTPAIISVISLMGGSTGSSPNGILTLPNQSF